MKLISVQEAAKQMDVPVAWVHGMRSQGLLAEHQTTNGFKLIDADELIVKRYASQEFESSSLAHVQSMLKKLAIEAQA